MPNIVPSLFGLNPEQVRQARSSEIQSGAANFAQMNPMQQAQSMLYQGGAGLGQAAGGMLGFQDPMMEQAKSRQQIASQMDMSTPEGYYAAARQAQARGDIELATNLISAGREIEQSAITDEFKSAQAQRMAQGSPVSTKPIKAVVDRNGENWNALLTQEGDVIKYLSKVSGKAGKDEEKSDVAQSANVQFDAIERNINELYDEEKETLKPNAAELFGQYAQYRPDALLSQESVDAKNALDSLTDQVMITNLTDAKERVGQSFGSMQAQEWDKFTRQLISLKRSQSPKSAAEAMKYVKNFIKTKRKVFDVAMGASKSGSDTRGLPQVQGSKFTGFSIVE